MTSTWLDAGPRVAMILVRRWRSGVVPTSMTTGHILGRPRLPERTTPDKLVPRLTLCQVGIRMRPEAAVIGGSRALARRAFVQLLVGLSLSSLAACSRPHSDPPAPSAPWPAEVRPSTPSLPVRFAVASHGTARFTTGRDGPAGELRVARGQLKIDLMNLMATRGTIEMDVGSVRVLADGEVDRAASAQAQCWFDVGPSRPESERERVRWARFTIDEVTESSVKAAHEAPRAHHPAAGAAGVAGAPGVLPAEVRTATLTAQGRLQLHGVRVELAPRLRLGFEYEAPAVAGAVPKGVQIATVGSFPVSLKAHDIQPRDAAGRLLAGELLEYKKIMGREARVSLDLRAHPDEGTRPARLLP